MGKHSDIEKYTILINSDDPNVSDDAHNRLWRLEEVGELAPETIVKFFKDKEKKLLIQYAIQAMGRLKNPVLYPPAAAAYAHEEDAMVLQLYLENFEKTGSAYFIDAALKKIGFKKNILKSGFKRDEAHWNRIKNRYRLIVLHTVKYLEVCATSSHLNVLLELLQSNDSAVRFHVLATFLKQKIDAGRNVIEDVVKHDKHILNVRQATLIIEVMYEPEKENPFSYIL